MNPWKVLGVHRKTAVEEVHVAFIKLAKLHHPDAGGDADKFRLINAAHRMLATKKEIYHTLNVTFADCKDCTACAGSGVKSKSKGITEKLYTACKVCYGAGIIIRSKEIDDVIEL